MTIGLQALTGQHSITGLAEDFEVSRNFVYRQADIAQVALEEAFSPVEDSEDKVLFHLPVTKAWLRQMTLGLVLICHSSIRGVGEFARDLLSVSLSVGTVHNYLHAAVAKARQHNLQQDLSGIAVAGLDEIFQQNRPVLVGADVASSYCFLLSSEDSCDTDTWAVRLLEATERGFMNAAAAGLAPPFQVVVFAASLLLFLAVVLPWFLVLNVAIGRTWPRWNEWVTPFSNGHVAARTPGEGLSVIEDAPGSYVRVRSDE
jgi:hypothetical protein